MIRLGSLAVCVAVVFAAKAGKFPKPVKLSDAAVGWLESDIDQWIASRV